MPCEERFSHLRDTAVKLTQYRQGKSAYSEQKSQVPASPNFTEKGPNPHFLGYQMDN